MELVIFMRLWRVDGGGGVVAWCGGSKVGGRIKDLRSIQKGLRLNARVDARFALKH